MKFSFLQTPGVGGRELLFQADGLGRVLSMLKF